MISAIKEQLATRVSMRFVRDEKCIQFIEDYICALECTDKVRPESLMLAQLFVLAGDDLPVDEYTFKYRDTCYEQFQKSFRVTDILGSQGLADRDSIAWNLMHLDPLIQPVCIQFYNDVYAN